jgi:phosphoribosyl 1,2-cyclic phosphodiesterase
VNVRLWGTRGSLATPGELTSRYGGDTSCVAITDRSGAVVVLDAGTGIRALGQALSPDLHRIDILLTHLHMDHIQGLAFFSPLFNPQIETHIWGPRSTTLTLRERITRYVSPPLFPVHLRDVAPDLQIHEIPGREFDIGAFHVCSELICHPNPTLGYRIEQGDAAVTYMPDHEPALGLTDGYVSGDWTSGYRLAQRADLLIHDAQYSRQEYAKHVGWGHSSIDDAFAFAELAGAAHLVPFHHDPSHTDDDLDELIGRTVDKVCPDFAVTPGTSGASIWIGSGSREPDG